MFSEADTEAMSREFMKHRAPSSPNDSDEAYHSVPGDVSSDEQDVDAEPSGSSSEIEVTDNTKAMVTRFRRSVCYPV